MSDEGPMVSFSDDVRLGMTVVRLRDYFAGLAMSHAYAPKADPDTLNLCAERAYALADAMLAAREKKP